MTSALYMGAHSTHWPKPVSDSFSPFKIPLLQSLKNNNNASFITGHCERLYLQCCSHTILLNWATFRQTNKWSFVSLPLPLWAPVPMYSPSALTEKLLEMKSSETTLWDDLKLWSQPNKDLIILIVFCLTTMAMFWTLSTFLVLIILLYIKKKD